MTADRTRECRWHRHSPTLGRRVCDRCGRYVPVPDVLAMLWDVERLEAERDASREQARTLTEALTKATPHIPRHWSFRGSGGGVFCTQCYHRTGGGFHEWPCEVERARRNALAAVEDTTVAEDGERS